MKHTAHTTWTLHGRAEDLRAYPTVTQISCPHLLVWVAMKRACLNWRAHFLVCDVICNTSLNLQLIYYFTCFKMTDVVLRIG